MPPKKQDTGITIIKTEKETSQQIVSEDRFKSIHGLVKPKHDPDALIYAYDNSFVVGGISDKFASTASSGWVFPDKFSEDAKNALKSLDLEYLFTTLFVTGNAYFEKIRTLKGGKTIGRFEQFITSEVRISKKDGKKLFNQVTTISGTPKIFNEEDVIHIKLKSIGSKYYGDSKFNRCIRQVVLLGLIDKYYESIFDGGSFGTSILADKGGKLSKEQREAIAANIRDKVKGMANAFSTIIVPAELEKIMLDKEFDTEAFLKYRKDLIQSIAIGLNIPFDLLVPEGSARATKESSIEEFNNDIVAPIQLRVLYQILSQISEEEIPGISEVKFIPIDRSNQKEEMQIHTGYKDSGVLTANEVRAMLGKEPHPEGDKLEVKAKNAPQDPQDKNPIDTEIAKIDEKLEKMYSQYE